MGGLPSTTRVPQAMRNERVSTRLSIRSTVQAGASPWRRPVRLPSGVPAWLLASVLTVSVGAASVSRRKFV